jgi:CMP-N-acetylneuraminic acid synthetase
MKKNLVVIPARGGSKGLPGKNLKPLGGVPLIGHAILAAKECQLISKIVISTDDKKITDYCELQGVEVIKRPDELATDTALVIDSIKYTVAMLEARGEFFSNIILLEPTSPLRWPGLIDDCITALDDPNFDCLGTFSKCHITPNRMWNIDGKKVRTLIDGAEPWMSRQAQPTAYELNGLVYVFKRENLSDENPKTFLTPNLYPVITPQDMSIDIDDEIDFWIAEKLYERMKNEKTL